jgi:hypothetical protein
MEEKRGRVQLRVAAIVTAMALMGTPWGFSTGWAAQHGQRGTSPTGQSQSMGGQAPMNNPTGATVLLERSPQTIEEYTAYVQNRLQVAAMKMRQQGTAELRLTIEKDGSIQQTDIVELEGAPTLRDQLRPLVNQIAPLPPLPGNAEVLVVATTLAFNYPGENLLDSFGRLSRAGN